MVEYDNTAPPIIMSVLKQRNKMCKPEWSMSMYPQGVRVHVPILLIILWPLNSPFIDTLGQKYIIHGHMGNRGNVKKGRHMENIPSSSVLLLCFEGCSGVSM